MTAGSIDTPLARLLSAISDPCALAKTSGEVEFVNDAFCAAYGVERADCLGAHDRDLVLGSSGAGLDPLDGDELFAGWGDGIELEARVADERRRVLCLPWHVGGQRRVLYVLPAAGRARTVDAAVLQELRDIERAQKREAVGRLASGVAHDFNNILTLILGLQEAALAEVGPDGPGSEPLGQLGRAATRAADLTRQLLTMVRQQPVQPRLCYLNEVVNDLERVFARIIEEEIELRTRLATELPTVWADRGQLDQVLTNLVVNARDAMPGGGVLEIATASVAAGEGPFPSRAGVSLSVTDTGSGIEDAVLDAIFEPFFTTKEVGRGTGLGLSVVRGIVEQNQGAIEVVSKPGVGTTFTVILPACQVAPVAAEETAREPVSADHPLARVLLVEDEDTIRGLLRDALERAGYRVLAATDGNDAWKKFNEASERAEPVDVVVTDVVMPGLGGVALVDKILKAAPSTRVLFISGYRDRDTPPGALVLSKPFGYQALVSHVRGLMDRPPAPPVTDSVRP